MLDRLLDRLGDNWIGSREAFKEYYQKVVMALTAGTLGHGFPDNIFVKSVVATFATKYAILLIVDHFISVFSSDKFRDKIWENALLYSAIDAIMNSLNAKKIIVRIACEEAEKELLFVLSNYLETVSNDLEVKNISMKDVENFISLIKVAVLDALDVDLSVPHLLDIISPSGYQLSDEDLSEVVNEDRSLGLTIDILTSLFEDGNNVGNVREMHETTLTLSWVRALNYNSAWLSQVKNNPSAAGRYSMVYFDRAVDVEMYNAKGTKVASIVQNEVNVSESGAISAYQERGKNVFVMPSDANYTFKVIGTADSADTVCSYQEYDIANGLSAVSNYQLSLEEGETYSAKVNNAAGSVENRYRMYDDSSNAVAPENVMTGSSIKRYTITKTVEGDGNIAGTSSVLAGENAILYAIPEMGADFKGWYIDDVLVSNDFSLDITPQKNTTVVAKFGYAVSAVELTAPSSSLAVGESMTIEHSVTPVKASDDTLFWKSSDESVATVDENGVVTAVGVGSAEITATAVSGVEAKVTLNVTMVVDDEWTLNTEDHTLRGVAEETTPDELIAHYEALGLTVTVTDADGNEPDLIGTGCIVSVNGEKYTVVVKGDVTGDGMINLFDLMAMVMYINDEKTLEGAYFEAGCYQGNDDIVIFDVYALLHYIMEE